MGIIVKVSTVNAYQELSLLTTEACEERQGDEVYSGLALSHGHHIVSSVRLITYHVAFATLAFFSLHRSPALQTRFCRRLSVVSVS